MSWHHAARRDGPDIGLGHIKDQHTGTTASPVQNAIVLHGISVGIATGAAVVPPGAIEAGTQARALRWQPIHRRFE